MASAEIVFENNGSMVPTTTAILKCFVKLAIPGIASNVLGVFMVLVNSIFAGRLGNPEMLAAVGLGNVTCVISFITMFMGLNAAQETLNSQAFGSGDTS